jgi:nitrite reductase/ring-hydroxylating ferredoxin subunit
MWHIQRDNRKAMSFIGNIEDFENNSATGLDVGPLRLLVLRRDQDIYIYHNSCPHTRESLDPTGGSVASPDGQLIHCQRHAAVFIADTGECVGGPCQGESLTALGFTLSNGDLYLD